MRKFSYRYTDGYDLINQRHNVKSFLEQQTNIIDLEYNALLINLQHILEKKNIQKLSLKLYKIPSEDILLMSSESVVHLNLAFDQITIKRSYNLINRFCKIFPNLRKLELGALNRLGSILKIDLTLDGLLLLKEVEIWSLRQSMLKEIKIGQALVKIKMYPVEGDEPANVNVWNNFAICNPNIQELELEDFPDYDILKTIVIGMKNLKVLSFGSSECRAINFDETVLDIIKTNCKHLRRLHIFMDLNDVNEKMMISNKFQDEVEIVLTHCDFIVYECTSDETATDPISSSNESYNE